MNELLQDESYSHFWDKNEILMGATSGEVVNLLDLSYEYISSERAAMIGKYGMDAYQDLLKNVIWQSKSVISYTDFCNIDIRNNIQCFFLLNIFGRGYRSQGIYQRFERNNPELAKKLLDIFAKDNALQDEYTLHSLYEMYLSMIQDPEVKTNQEIFA